MNLVGMKLWTSFLCFNFDLVTNLGSLVSWKILEMLRQLHSPNSNTSTTTNNSNDSNTISQTPHKKKRNLPGNPGHLITSLTLFFFIHFFHLYQYQHSPVRAFLSFFLNLSSWIIKLSSSFIYGWWLILSDWVFMY